MAYVLVTNGVIVQKQPYPGEGFIQVDDSVACGMLYSKGVATYPPAAPVDTNYSIAKTTPWLRMTSDEATLVMGAMQTVEPRLQAIYAAATYISTADALFSVLHDLVASALGSTTRADELLARES